MKREPYIGVTGFMSGGEVVAALASLPVRSGRKLMVGELASMKTLNGHLNKYPNRYPKMADLSSVFVESDRTINLIHYATDDKSTLASQLKEVIKLAGPLLNGFQLNVAWPDPASLDIPALPNRRIVLQLGRRALEEAGDDPEQTARMLDDYDGVVTDILIDPSGGKGLPFDPTRAVLYLGKIAARHPDLGIGVAGGLSAETVASVAPVVKEFPNISVDAEGRLRTAEDQLDCEMMRQYIRAAAAVVA